MAGPALRHPPAHTIFGASNVEKNHRQLHPVYLFYSHLPSDKSQKMGHSYGKRAGTRYAFSRDFKKKGYIALSTYLRQYKIGDIVDVVANGAVQKGMPYKVYHGKTGIIYNVTKSSVGVILHKQVRNRYMEKRINVRVEHVRKSRSRDEFLNRVKENAAKRITAKEEGKHVHLKRLAVQPREARTVAVKDNKPENIAPIAYDTSI